jgi:two-component system alkaline phosphatase synthesis response regulator PhoP
MTKILVIEDDQNIQKLARANLAASGYKVLVADNGEDGVKLTRKERPDLVLLDLMLPGMSGWDVLMRIRTDRKLRGMPVIIMTATAPQGADYKFASMRTAGYLVKPFEIRDLVYKVAQVLRTGG